MGDLPFLQDPCPAQETQCSGGANGAYVLKPRCRDPHRRHNRHCPRFNHIRFPSRALASRRGRVDARDWPNHEPGL